MMLNVTERVNEVKQPYGGYIKLSEFETIVINDNITLNAEENIHGSIVGIVVDYLTRYLIDGDLVKIFHRPLQGATIAELRGGIKNAKAIADNLLKGIKGIDDNSVINACKLVTFEVYVWRINSLEAIRYKGYKETNPDKATVENIQTLVKRSMALFEKYGSVTKYGFTVGGGTVWCGDGDFLTADTLWDFKVSKTKPNSKNTLQLLMYYIMGKHSGQDIFKNITRIGIFNPRLNAVYLLEMSKVSEDIINAVEQEVICYGNELELSEGSKETFKIRAYKGELYRKYFEECLVTGTKPFTFAKWQECIYSSEYLESHADPETAEYLKTHDIAKQLKTKTHDTAKHLKIHVEALQKQLYREYFDETLATDPIPFSFAKWQKYIYSSEYLESHADHETAEFLKAHDLLLKK